MAFLPGRNLESLVLLGLYKIHGFCLAGLAVSMPKLRYLHLEQCNEVSATHVSPQPFQ